MKPLVTCNVLPHPTPPRAKSKSTESEIRDTFEVRRSLMMIKPFQNDVRNQMPNMEPKASQLDPNGTPNPN